MFPDGGISARTVQRCAERSGFDGSADVVIRCGELLLILARLGLFELGFLDPADCLFEKRDGF